MPKLPKPKSKPDPICVTVNPAIQVNTGIPPKSGTYIVYAEPLVGIHPTKQLMTYLGGQWGRWNSDQGYRGEVYAWIGPLPKVTVGE